MFAGRRLAARLLELGLKIEFILYQACEQKPELFGFIKTTAGLLTSQRVCLKGDLTKGSTLVWWRAGRSPCRALEALMCMSLASRAPLGVEEETGLAWTTLMPAKQPCVYAPLATSSLSSS